MKYRNPFGITDAIRQFMAEHNCTMDDLTGRSRVKRLVLLRKEIIKRLDAEGYGPCDIARRLKCHHSTIYHHLRPNLPSGSVSASRR